MQKKRKRIRAYGEVQGVGFRYTASRVADYLGVTGYVQNEYDGSVTLEIQGTREDLREFLPDILSSSRWIRIEGTEEEDIDPLPDEEGFTIRD